MSVHSSIGTSKAQAELAVAKARGTTATYTHRAEYPVTIYCRWFNDVKTNSDPLSTKAEESIRRFRIALQTSFPPANGISLGDVLTVNEIEYSITRVFDEGGYGTVFDVDAIRTQPVKATHR